MTEQPLTKEQQKAFQIRKFFEIKKELADAKRAASVLDLNSPARLALEADIWFLLSELSADEMHTDSHRIRRACGAILDSNGFDRDEHPDDAEMRIWLAGSGRPYPLTPRRPEHAG